MEKTDNAHESRWQGIPDGMFISSYRAYLANLDFLAARREGPQSRANSDRKQSVAPRVLKTNDAAVYLSISAWKLRNLVQSGEISYIAGNGTSPWLFDKLELDRWIETRKVKL
jgi:excisionase family DNA binding protein